MLILWLALAAAPSSNAAREKRPDALLDQLVGRWQLVGKGADGQPVSDVVDIDWQLGFLRIHQRDTRAQFEALFMIGALDPVRYVAHRFGPSGVRAASTLGSGVQDGDALVLTFDYPDGGQRFRLARAEDKRWQWDVQNKAPGGEWKPFESFRLLPAPAPFVVRRLSEVTARTIMAGLGKAWIVLDEESTGSPALAFDILEGEAGASVPVHSHEGSAEVLYILEGQAVTTVRDSARSIGAGDVAYIPPDAPHSARFITRTRALQVYTPAGPEQRFKAGR